MSSKIELSYVSQKIIEELEHVPQCSCNKRKAANKLAAVFPRDPESCIRAKKWIKNVKVPQNPESVYLKLVLMSNSMPSDPQLTLDVSRTHSNIRYFAIGKGKKSLIRMLNTFCVYNPNLGYVQGMNYIAATLLWHANEVDAFWLFIILLEDFEVRENFIPGFPGLNRHYHVIDFLISQHLPKLYAHFLNQNIVVEMFTTEWFMTLFTSNIPLEHSHIVLGKFFRQGWVFFYKLCFEIVKRLSTKLLQACSYAGILSILRPADHSSKQWKAFVKNLEKGKESSIWKKVVSGAETIYIDERFLNCMLHNAKNVLQDDVPKN
jgi:Rab-GTPase-TBC domain